ncbi:hypothetical protein K7X08_031470 [Anisodus acutangulus]|uniref:Uncharacterized protein n=1 Tax=Anisodus acutangulus TaxID=402998 RepID=A0A9Q1MPR1_9SOLA|nr:hypothetical protein K7X08_031470 [Anisodus acutangulus]
MLDLSTDKKQIELSPNDIKLIHKAFPLIRVLDVESLKLIFSREFNQLYHLRYVAISGDFKALPPAFVQLPAAFFRLVRTVKKLSLANIRFSWSEANRLAQLESLELLKLKENAFVGESWEPETGGFSTLQVLWIERSELESWEASSLNFPILRHLVLISCDKLKAVPLGLADIHNIQEMRLDNTSKGAVKSAKEIESKKPKFKLTIFPPETDSKDTQ